MSDPDLSHDAAPKGAAFGPNADSRRGSSTWRSGDGDFRPRNALTRDWCETGVASRDNGWVTSGRNATFRSATAPSRNCQNPHRLFWFQPSSVLKSLSRQTTAST